MTRTATKLNKQEVLMKVIVADIHDQASVIEGCGDEEGLRGCVQGAKQLTVPRRSLDPSVEERQPSGTSNMTRISWDVPCGRGIDRDR